jgi:hypothetical protein
VRLYKRGHHSRSHRTRRDPRHGACVRVPLCAFGAAADDRGDLWRASPRPLLSWSSLPRSADRLFPDDGATPLVLDAVYHLGPLLLMFVAGTEIRSVFQRDERTTAAAITASGTIFPFLTRVLRRCKASDGIPARLRRCDRGNEHSRDLANHVRSRQHRHVVRAGRSHRRSDEDVILYVLLAITIGLVQVEQGDDFGLLALLGSSGGPELGVAYHIAAALTFFGFFLLARPRLLRGVAVSLQPRTPARSHSSSHSCSP